MLALFAMSALLLAVACRADDTPREAGEIATDIGVENQTIHLGELSPMTGPVAIIGQPLTRGHEVYFQYVNEELGGVGQVLPEEERFRVELHIQDTQYLPDVHVAQYEAVRDRVLMIAQSLGTPTTKAILPQVNEDGVLTGAATLSVDWLRERYVIPAGAPYPIQFVNAADYIVNELGEEPRVGHIYQDDDYGEEGRKGLTFASEELGFEIVGETSYRPGDTEFAAQVSAMRDAGATHVFLTTTPDITGPILGTAATLEYAPQWIGMSPSWIGALAQQEALLPYMQQYLWVVSDASCAWGDTSPGCEGMEEMLQNIETYASDQEPDLYFLFGYTQARIVHQILERAVERGDLTRQGVVEAFEDLRDVDMAGLLNPISYGPECEDKVPTTASAIWGINPNEPAALERLAEVDSNTIDDFPFCP